MTVQRLRAADWCIPRQTAAVRVAAARPAPRTVAVALPGEWLGSCQLRQSSGSLQLTVAAPRRPSNVVVVCREMALVSDDTSSLIADPSYAQQQGCILDLLIGQ